MCIQSDQDNCKFSVLVAVYNCEPYLRVCLDSIVDQDFADYELILVDDGSTDRGGEICDEYAAKYSHVRVVHKENGGLSTARNAGLDAAKGKYIVFVDADDSLPSGALAVMAERAMEAETDIVIHGFSTFRERQRINTKSPGVVGLSGKEALRHFLSYQIPMTSWGKTYQRKIFDSLRFDPKARMGQDTLFNITCTALLSCSIQTCDTDVYNYALRKDSISFDGRFYEKYLNLSALVKEVLADADVLDQVSREYAVFDTINIVQAAFKSRKSPDASLIQRMIEHSTLCSEKLPEMELRIVRLFSFNKCLGRLYLNYRFARLALKEWLGRF